MICNSSREIQNSPNRTIDNHAEKKNSEPSTPSINIDYSFNLIQSWISSVERNISEYIVIAGIFESIEEEAPNVEKQQHVLFANETSSISIPKDGIKLCVALDDANRSNLIHLSHSTHIFCS